MVVLIINHAHTFQFRQLMKQPLATVKLTRQRQIHTQFRLIWRSLSLSFPYPGPCTSRYRVLQPPIKSIDLLVTDHLFRQRAEASPRSVADHIPPLLGPPHADRPGTPCRSLPSKPSGSLQGDLQAFSALGSLRRKSRLPRPRVLGSAKDCQ